MNSIHGNEASGANASLFLHIFYCRENPDILKLLDNTIIIITPGLNQMVLTGLLLGKLFEKFL
jgi:hypothetical protein